MVYPLLFFLFNELSLLLSQKERYPVTVHVLDFDYVEGCSEFKRCKSKRTLKNVFESCLVKFKTTLKLLRIS